MSNLKDLEAQIAALQSQRDGLLKEQKAGAIAQVRETIAQFGLTADDLFSSKRKDSGAKVAPKYRDPATGATWTGRGKAPAWIADAANRDQFLIQAKQA